jgi:hypothetical protein
MGHVKLVTSRIDFHPQSCECGRRNHMRGEEDGGVIAIIVRSKPTSWTIKARQISLFCKVLVGNAQTSSRILKIGSNTKDG